MNLHDRLERYETLSCPIVSHGKITQLGIKWILDDIFKVAYKLFLIPFPFNDWVLRPFIYFLHVHLSPIIQFFASLFSDSYLSVFIPDRFLVIRKP